MNMFMIKLHYSLHYLVYSLKLRPFDRGGMGNHKVLKKLYNKKLGFIYMVLQSN